MEPAPGFEPGTYGLQDRSSTPELCRLSAKGGRSRERTLEFHQFSRCALHVATRPGQPPTRSPAPLPAPQPLPQRLIEDRRRRRGDVERVEAAPHRQADRRVAEGAGADPQTALLAVMYALGCMLFTGLPKIPLTVLACCCAGLAWTLTRREERAVKVAAAKQKPKRRPRASEKSRKNAKTSRGGAA